MSQGQLTEEQAEYMDKLEKDPELKRLVTINVNNRGNFDELIEYIYQLQNRVRTLEEMVIEMIGEEKND